MKINFLYDFFSTQPYGKVLYHGGGSYGVSVAKILLSRKELRDKVNFFFAVNKQHSVSDKELLGLLKEAKVKLLYIADQKEIIDIIYKNNIDTFFSPVPYYLSDMSFDSDILSGIKIKGTIHGLRNLEIYRDSKEIYYRQGIINKLKAVYKYIAPDEVVKREKRKIKRLLEVLDMSCLTQTKHTKYSLISHFPDINKECIFVDTVFPDYLFSENIVSRMPEGFYNLPVKKNRYFLLVGGGRREKNLVRACEAMEIADSVLPMDFTLIATGVPGYIQKRLLRNKKIRKRCLFLEYVEPASLNYLYENCYALIYPSLSEGLGYPPLEAFRYGKPVLASSVTAVPVFYGDSVIYFNPYDIYEIANRMCYILEDVIYNDFSDRGYSFYLNIKEYTHTHSYDTLVSYIFD